MKKITKRTITGTIVSDSTIVSENMKLNNAKWASISYMINGQTFVSENTIQVPMQYNVGDTLEIKYDVDNPVHIFTKRLFVF